MPDNGEPQVNAFRLESCNPFGKVYRKIRYKLSNLQKMFRLYIHNEKEIKIDHYRTTIKNFHKIGANRKYDVKEFY